MSNESRHFEGMTMSHMLALLDEMRRHRSVAVYVGKTSLLKLADFLQGYEYALQKLGVEDSSLLADFRDWIQQRFGTSKQSWEQLIVTQCGSDVDAVAEFWRLMDEFRATHSAVSSSMGTVPVSPVPLAGGAVEMARKPA